MFKKIQFINLILIIFDLNISYFFFNDTLLTNFKRDRIHEKQ